ncbi:DEAD/DEAH box helicase [Lentilitoribacter sp. EG35]|uniref:DEAD/DEAH box helicase n=1 Tax=Lentilitoribacter sp. EG35 TaxID=3234192 RepID=UPI003461762B
MTTFSDLGLSTKVLTAVEDAGYTTPTPIQAGAIPPALQRKDVLGIAQTGTGKTASFVLPMLTLLEKGRARARMPRTLILEPTRELAAQVAENFDKYGKNLRLNVALLIGGVSFAEQDRKLERGADVLIATPGRLLDHCERGKLLMTGVELLVIDEADRMLDMGFIPDIERIAKLIPFTRQTLFFSATMPPVIQTLADQFLQNPTRIEVAPPSSTAATVTQHLVKCKSKDYEKRETLRELIRTQEDVQNGIIFCNRKKSVADLHRSLERHGFSVGALHGDMDQRSRMTTLQGFKDNEIKFLVASDVAARGLDIPAVSHVFNYDAPTHAEDYVHRIGRTGRAGREGAAFTMIGKSDKKYIDAIEALINTKIEYFELAGDTKNSAPVDAKAKPAKRTRKPKKQDANEAAAPVRSNNTLDTTSENVVSSVGNNRNDNVKKPRNNNRRKNDRDDGPTPVGFGDEIPAFMLISAKAS